MKRKINYTRGEELWNSWSHAAGILLAVVVGTLFIVWAARHENGWATFGVSLYLFGMLGSYVASTVYHAIPPTSPLPTGEGSGVGLSPLPTGEGQGVGLLLRIKVDDKLYRPITHYRDTILQLVDYFEQHPRVLPRLLGKTGPALPYLYAGRVFADLGDAPQALDYYQSALDVMHDGQIENGEWKIEMRRLAASPSSETCFAVL